MIPRAWDSSTTRVLSYWGNNNNFHNKKKQLFFDTLLDKWVEKTRNIIVEIQNSIQIILNFLRTIERSEIQRGSKIQDHGDIV